MSGVVPAWRLWDLLNMKKLLDARTQIDDGIGLEESKKSQADIEVTRRTP
jgi:hypothetical protein